MIDGGPRVIVREVPHPRAPSQMSTRWRLPVFAAVACTVIAGCDDGTGVSGTPATLRKIAGDSVASPVASAVGTLPVVAVLQGDGAPVKNAVVTFAVADTASGTVAGSVVRTDERGLASPVGWNLGRRAGVQRLVARVTGLGDSVVFVARAQASGAFRVEAASATVLAGTVNQQPTVLPAVRLLDLYGNPVAGEGVDWAVDTVGGIGAGAGSIASSQTVRIVSDSSGIARAPWVLGRTAGRQRIGAEYRGGNRVVFEATARPDVPSRVVLVTGQASMVAPNTTYARFPRFIVTDAFQNVIVGEPVRFTLTDAGGTLAQGVDTSDVTGIVDPGTWTTGPQTGRKTVRAALVRDTTVSATATIQSTPGGATQFTITVRLQGTVTPEVQAAFDSAARRWADIIIGDLPDVTVGGTGVTCSIGRQPFTLAAGTVVDDIVIDAAIVAFDGPGNVLGSAGPCFLRNDASALPFFGAMRFDEADMQELSNSGNLVNVILHEMGHVLGIGSLWELKGLLPNPVPAPCNDRTADPRYVGAQAIERYRARGGQDAAIAVENINGCGTANGHWRENVFANELMTGFLNAGIPNPLSGMTIGTLADMGYEVSFATAEPCSGLLSCVMSDTAAPVIPGTLIPLHETPLDAPPRRLPRDARGRVYMPLK